MKTIVFVLERLGNGGAERVTAALANSLSRSPEYRIHVFTYVKEENEYILSCNVERHILNDGRVLTGINGVRRKIAYLKEEIRKITPDYVISLATPKTSILLSIVSIHRKYKLIISERNDPERYPSGNLLRLLRNQAYRMADGIVFQTPDAKEYFSKIKTRNEIIPNPVSDQLPSVYTGTRKKRIVDFCRIEPQKNIKLLIDAFADLPEKYNDYVLEIFGIGDQLDEMKQYANEMCKTKKVIFQGFEKNIYERINDAALFVSSSDYEGISNSMIEALALGIPTVCTDCPIGGARMMINSGVNGLLVPVGDTNAMTKAIEYMLSNPIEAKRMGENAVNVRKDCSADAIAEKWLSFIGSL